MSMKNMRRQVPNLLKDGHKQYSGLEGVVLRNIDACKKLSKVTRTSLGPNGTRTRLLFRDSAPVSFAMHGSRAPSAHCGSYS